MVSNYLVIQGETILSFIYLFIYSFSFRNLSWGSTRTSVSSSSTEYFSAISSDEDDLNDFSTPEADPANSLLETLVGDDNLLNIFTRVDDLMEGSRDQQLLSLNVNIVHMNVKRVAKKPTVNTSFSNVDKIETFTDTGGENGRVWRQCRIPWASLQGPVPLFRVGWSDWGAW